MNAVRPCIGITTGYDYDKNMLYLKEGYYEGVFEAGGLAIAIPPTHDENILFEIFNRCEGFLLTGGPDIDGNLYGEENLEWNGEISPIRDFAEIFIVKKAMSYNKPLLGICRGIQVMNVAMGGTLYQDIHCQRKESLNLKHSQNAPKWYPTHDVTIQKDSWVRKSFVKEQEGVNSFHHQAVKDLAQGFLVTAQSNDGVIEAIEHESHKFAVGVQWHPELMWQKDRKYLNLFIELIKQAGNTTT